jgi:hypothetical protein
MNTYLWLKTTYSTFSNIINSSIQDLLNILEKYKKYDYLFVMNDNEVYNNLNEMKFVEEDYTDCIKESAKTIMANRKEI